MAMDDQNRPTPVDNTPQGAPELSKGVKPPSAPLVSDRQTGPIFRAAPPEADAPVVPVNSAPSPAFDDDDETPQAPPALDEHQARIDYLKSLRQQDNSKRKKGGKVGHIILIILLILLVLGALGAAAYFWYHSSRPAATTKQPAKTQTQPTTPATQESATQDDQPVATKDYTSTTFTLSLAYPGNWTPEEVPGKLTITSPVVQLTDANGQTTNGKIVLLVRPHQDKPAEFTAGNVVAVLDSETVNYTKPSSTQAGSTYLSYLQYATTKTKGGLDGIYITGDYGYKYGQDVKVTDISKLDPLVDVTFVSCADTTCVTTTQQPLTISSSSWQSDTTVRPAVDTMLKSLTIH
jgi:cytoskeletal protein RodZ